MRPLSPSVLLAIGCAPAPEAGPQASLARDADVGVDTDTARGDTGVGPCLTVQTCLCTCENGAATGGWMLTGVGLLALGRRGRGPAPRSRAAIVAELEAREALTPELLKRVRERSEGDAEVSSTDDLARPPRP